jgi:hypothetical protein
MVKFYSLDRAGNVIKVDYLPATTTQPQGGMSKLFQGLEAIVDPASAYERGTYRKLVNQFLIQKHIKELVDLLKVFQVIML